MAAASLTGIAIAAVPPGAHAAPDGGQRTSSLNEVIQHGVPSVPLTIDGKSVSPETITRYNGQPLYSAVLPEGPHGRLVTFTRRADFERFVSQNGGPTNALTPPPVSTPDRTAAIGPAQPGAGRFSAGSANRSAAANSSGASLWEDAGGFGAWIWVESGYGWPDLTQIDLRCVLWFCTSWNDEASSALGSAGGLTIWDDIWFSGSSLWLPGGNWDDLGIFGWNDRVSSFGSH